jgi:hypothetical protein
MQGRRSDGRELSRFNYLVSIEFGLEVHCCIVSTEQDEELVVSREIGWAFIEF